MKAQVWIVGRRFHVFCHVCRLTIAEFSKHEAAMAFADKHMRNSDHVTRSLL